jgi:CMP/dCMP kinase
MEKKMSTQFPVIAIDGPAGAGKGTLCHGLSKILDYAVLDTGKLYRAVAKRTMIEEISPDNIPDCEAVAQTLTTSDLEQDGLRTEEVGQVASKVSAIPGVRLALYDFQVNFAANPPDGKEGAILDGRDIGTVICPHATLKIYLTADTHARALRRHAEALSKGEDSDFLKIKASIQERDEREATRAAAPMRPADDAIIIDTSTMTPEEVLATVLEAFLQHTKITTYQSS